MIALVCNKNPDLKILIVGRNNSKTSVAAIGKRSENGRKNIEFRWNSDGHEHYGSGSWRRRTQRLQNYLNPHFANIASLGKEIPAQKFILPAEKARKTHAGVSENDRKVVGIGRKSNVFRWILHPSSAAPPKFSQLPLCHSVLLVRKW